jgi:hypothetical protein
MWLFRFPHWVYFVLAPLVAAFAVFMYFDMTGDDAARVKALKHHAPAAVAIESYDPVKHVADADEVTILAQLDLASMSEVVRTKRGSERGRTTLGMLYSTTAEAPEGKALGMMVIDGAVNDDKLVGLAVAEGKFGPIMKLNGTTGADWGKGSETDLAAEHSAGLAENAVYITPFLNGRETDLAPRGGAGEILAFLLAAAAAIGGYGWHRLRQQRKWEQAMAEPGQHA